MAEFAATAISMVGNFKGQCLIYLNGESITVKRMDRMEIAKWPYICIRQFRAEEEQGRFSFVSGRRGPYGVAEYNFVLSQGMLGNLQEALSQFTGAQFSSVAPGSGSGENPPPVPTSHRPTFSGPSGPPTERSRGHSVDNIFSTPSQNRGGPRLPPRDYLLTQLGNPPPTQADNTRYSRPNGHPKIDSSLDYQTIDDRPPIPTPSQAHTATPPGYTPMNILTQGHATPPRSQSPQQRSEMVMKSIPGYDTRRGVFQKQASDSRPRSCTPPLVREDEGSKEPPKLPPKYMPAVVTPPPEELIISEKRSSDHRPPSQEVDQNQSRNSRSPIPVDSTDLDSGSRNSPQRSRKQDQLQKHFVSIDDNDIIINRSPTIKGRRSPDHKAFKRVISPATVLSENYDVPPNRLSGQKSFDEVDFHSRNSGSNLQDYQFPTKPADIDYQFPTKPADIDYQFPTKPADIDYQFPTKPADIDYQFPTKPADIDYQYPTKPADIDYQFPTKPADIDYQFPTKPADIDYQYPTKPADIDYQFPTKPADIDYQFPRPARDSQEYHVPKPADIDYNIPVPYNNPRNRAEYYHHPKPSNDFNHRGKPSEIYDTPRPQQNHGSSNRSTEVAPQADQLYTNFPDANEQGSPRISSLRNPMTKSSSVGGILPRQNQENLDPLTSNYNSPKRFGSDKRRHLVNDGISVQLHKLRTAKSAESLANLKIEPPSNEHNMYVDMDKKSPLPTADNLYAEIPADYIPKRAQVEQGIGLQATPSLVPQPSLHSQHQAEKINTQIQKQRDLATEGYELCLPADMGNVGFQTLPTRGRKLSRENVLDVAPSLEKYDIQTTVPSGKHTRTQSADLKKTFDERIKPTDGTEVLGTSNPNESAFKTPDEYVIITHGDSRPKITQPTGIPVKSEAPTQFPTEEYTTMSAVKINRSELLYDSPRPSPSNSTSKLQQDEQYELMMPASVEKTPASVVGPEEQYEVMKPVLAKRETLNSDSALENLSNPRTSSTSSLEDDQVIVAEGQATGIPIPVKARLRIASGSPRDSSGMELKSRTQSHGNVLDYDPTKKHGYVNVSDKDSAGQSIEEKIRNSSLLTAAAKKPPRPLPKSALAAKPTGKKPKVAPRKKPGSYAKVDLSKAKGNDHPHSSDDAH